MGIYPFKSWMQGYWFQIGYLFYRFFGVVMNRIESDVKRWYKRSKSQYKQATLVLQGLEFRSKDLLDPCMSQWEWKAWYSKKFSANVWYASEKIADRNLTRAQMVVVVMVVVGGGKEETAPSTFLHIAKNERIYRHQTSLILSFINFTYHDRRNFPSVWYVGRKWSQNGVMFSWFWSK